MAAIPSTNPVTFSNDILPIFYNYQSNMMWRLDLTNYESVKINAELIYGLISSGQMPPPNYPPLPQEQIDLFQQWMQGGYQP